MKQKFLLFILCHFSFLAFSQSASEIQHNLEKLKNFNSVLYIAAHPDDENTRVIAWLSKGRLVETSYLSLTRGDGGQNLIGEELGPELGILRTQELLAARNIDGGNQYFSRAVDFGYSKTAEETLEFWDKEKILSDVVRVIRQTKPDVIITRFPPDERAGHGHHTASAILALEAFDKAADQDYRVDELGQLEPWSVKSVYWNASSWWNPKLDSIAAVNPDYLAFDIGGYDPLLGVNYNELGSLARSQHKCQGFGVSIDRGSTMEYFQWLKGEKLSKDFFTKETTSWNNLAQTRNGGYLVDKIIEEFNPKEPGKSLNDLFELKRFLERPGGNAFWKKVKQNELDELIMACAGLHLEANTKSPYGLAGQSTAVEVEVLSRNQLLEPVVVKSIVARNNRITLDQSLEFNKKSTFKIEVENPVETTQPYWLELPYTTVYNVIDSELIGKPENDPAISVDVEFNYLGKPFVINIPVEYKWSDRVEGEMVRPYIIAPSICGTLDQSTYVVVGADELTVTASIKHFGPKNQEYSIGVMPLDGDVAKAPFKKLTFDSQSNEKKITFTLPIPKEKKEFSTYLLDQSGNPLPGFQSIEYNHIPYQTSFTTKVSKVIKPEIEITKNPIAYVQGAGDQVDKALRELGCQVVNLTPEDLSTVDLSVYETIVFGIRAFNVYPELKNSREAVLNYIANGGNVVVQYNTSSRWGKTEIPVSPFSMTIGRDRISEEKAEIDILKSRNELMRNPNKIEDEDFEGWVQERGLYFATEFSEEFIPVLSGHDKGEDEKQGALIVAHYGKGRFIYTGISFFRELPAGVSGAYRILANLVTYEP